MQTNLLLSNDQINEIRKSVDIVNVISDYIPLTTRGKNFFGVCPFHADHSPSMSISKEKQIYTCFSCGASGNVFNFIMDYENISFIEAIKIVADKAGIPLSINTKQDNTSKFKELYDIFELTQKFYTNNINTNLGLEAKQYLNNRNLDNNVIKEFGIGLSLNKIDVLTNLLIDKLYSQSTIERTGLVSKRDKGYTDTYVNRIMFPLFDLTGKIVGYSGRVYNSESKSKYFNIRETEIFKKGELLYNYHKAKESTRQEGKLIVVEGFLDVIRLYTIGINNVVATMGTAVTKNQALLMKRLSGEIILCFDGDNAGDEATASCMDELSKIGIIPKVVRLENNLDPDEYIIKFDGDKFKDKINNAMNAMDYKMSYFKKDKDLNNNLGMAKYVDMVIEELNKINNETYSELSLNKLSQESNLNLEYLKSRLYKREEKIEQILEPKKIIRISKYEKAEQHLLYYMLSSKEVVKLYNKKQPFVHNENYRKLAREISLYYKEFGSVELADLITYFKDNALLFKTIMSLVNLNIKDDFTIEEINDYIKVLKIKTIDDEILKLQDRIRFEIDPLNKAKILQEIIRYKKIKDGDEEHD